MTFNEFLAEWRNDAPTVRAITSGSTGKPKTIELEKSFLRRSGERTNRFFSINSRSRLHSCVGADYIGGKMMAVRADIAGCRFSSELPSNRPLSSLTKDEEISLLAVVPSQMLHIIENIDKIPKIKAILIGGAPLHPLLREKIIASGLDAWETYGMTETASHIALRKVDKLSEWFYLLDGITVESDSRGCLIIRFQEGEEVITNDLAEIRQDGGFKIKGRYDNVIITGGKKVSPEEVESKITPLIEEEFLITSRPDEKWGERIVLLIEGERGDEQSLRKELRNVLAPHEMPKEIEWITGLERTPNGKLKRR